MQVRKNYIFEFCHKPYVSCQQQHVISAVTGKLDLRVPVIVIVTHSDDGCESSETFPIAP